MFLYLRCIVVAIPALLLAILLSGCELERTPEWQSSASPSPSSGPAETLTESKAEESDGRITIHYHRVDEAYDQANLHVWDAAGKEDSEATTLLPSGRDDFGAVFQLDRAEFAGSDRIGFIARLGDDWKRKDGGDRFWTPALGSEVWVVGGKDGVWKERPDISPHVEAAFLDAPDRVVTRFNVPAPRSAVAVIRNENNALVGKSRMAKVTGSPYQLVLTTPRLDAANHRYSVQIPGYGDPVPIVPRGVLDDRAHFFDGDAVLGATYRQAATTFRLFAPTADSVQVVLYDEASGDGGRVERALQRNRNGIWEGTVNGDLRGRFYTYRLEGPGLDPTRELVDPYATNTVASSSRARISNLTGKTGEGPRMASPTDMVIYEMSVRDFTIAPNSGVERKGLYLGFAETNTRLVGDPQIRTGLDHLLELGVTHVQLMPVHDFENDESERAYNWGYITTNYFSPEGMFATNERDKSRVRELKMLIASLHARGIGVILDVVYNHTSGNAPFSEIVPGYYYRLLPDGSYSNGADCGNEFRTEAPMARKLMLDSLKFWVKEYGIDGFRFDLMALHDRETMREVERELRAINPDIVLYGEPWMASTTTLVETTDKEALGEVPVGAFNDDFRNALKGAPDGDSPGWIQNGSHAEALKKAMRISDWFPSPTQSINYMTCHDNLVLWDKLKRSMPNADDALLIRTMKLGYLALFTAQGVPFIHGGEEFARTKGGNHNSYNAPDSVNQVDWSLKRKNVDLFAYVRDLIALRKAHPVFRLPTKRDVARRLRFQRTPSDRVIQFTLDGRGVRGERWRRVCVILNSEDENSVEVALPPGRWSVGFDENGRSPMGTLSQRTSVPAKSGLVLYQR